MVVLIRNVDVPGFGDRDSSWTVERGARRSAAIAGKCGGVVACEVCDDAALQIELANYIVRCVGDVEIAKTIQRDSVRRVQKSSSSLTSIAGVSLHAERSGDRRNDAGGCIHAPDRVIRAIGKVEIACSVDGN